jgi:hypothetical protein
MVPTEQSRKWLSGLAGRGCHSSTVRPRASMRVPDATEGITRVEDLPKPKIVGRKRGRRRQTCPHCGHRAYRDRRAQRVLHDVGDLVSGRPHDIHLAYSVHYGTPCGKYFNADMSDLALPKSHFRTALEARGLALQGIAADGLPLYPLPPTEILPGVPHRICEFHVLAETTKAVLHAVAKVRKELDRQKERLGRGRPRSPQAKRAARKNRRLKEKIGDLFEHRHLFAAHHLPPPSEGFFSGSLAACLTYARSGR